MRIRRDPDDRRGEPMLAGVTQSPGVAALLRPQASAGNQATARLLREARQAEEIYAAMFSGLGTYEVASAQLLEPNQMQLAMPASDAGPLLMQRSTTGEPIATVEISLGVRTFTLTEALVESFTPPPAVPSRMTSSRCAPRRST
jgi:hypothetical protein